jgi:transposase-like protein
MEENVRKNGKKKLNADEKWRIYQETSVPGAQVGEILRKYGMYPAELAKIRQQAEKGAKEEFGRNKYRKRPIKVDYNEHQKIKDELSAKEKALAEMSQEYLILKKKVNLE